MADNNRFGNEYETLKGSIEHVVYYNDSNDYAVLEILLENDLVITAVGAMPVPFEGECVVLSGKWGYHKEFGKQFSFESFEKNPGAGSRAGNDDVHCTALHSHPDRRNRQDHVCPEGQRC